MTTATKSKTKAKTTTTMTRRKPVKKVKNDRLKWVMAVSAGCSTPILVLAMSTLSADIASLGGSKAYFALLPFTVMVAMLIVSTPHIAEAKLSVGWPSWQAWAFAIGIDFAITCAEFMSVWVPTNPWLTSSVVIGGVLYSALLNTIVNLRHAKLVD